jgi:hypothetical protein
LFTLDTEVSDGVDSLSGTSRITYEWDNKCVALDNAYMEHLRRSLEFMIYKSEPKDASRFSELAEDARSSIIDSLKDPKTIDLENGESMDLNQDEIDQLTEELDKMLAKISYDPKYIENPPYLPATCGGGVASCVDMALCGVMVESVSIEKLGLGMIIENLAFKESPRQETESMLMTPDSQNIDFEDIKMEQSVLIQTDNVTEIENLDSGKSNLDSSAQFDKGSLVSPVKDSGVESNV